MVGKILEFQPIKHIYNTDNCSGCHKEIEDNEIYTEVVMDHGDRKEYIALCSKCYKVAEGYGVF